MKNFFLDLLGYTGSPVHEWKDFDISIKRNTYLRVALFFFLLVICIVGIFCSSTENYLGMRIPVFILFLIPLAYGIGILTYILDFAYGHFNVYIGNVTRIEDKSIYYSKNKKLANKTVIRFVDDEGRYFSFSGDSHRYREGMRIAVYTPQREASQTDMNEFLLTNIKAVTVINQIS